MGNVSKLTLSIFETQLYINKKPSKIVFPQFKFLNFIPNPKIMKFIERWNFWLLFTMPESKYIQKYNF